MRESLDNFILGGGGWRIYQVNLDRIIKETSPSNIPKSSNEVIFSLK